jgi:predicted transcriptional regulator YdeE
MPKIEVVSHHEVKVVGLKYHGKNQAGEIPKLWQEIDQYWDKIQSLDEAAHAGYGISMMDEDFEKTMVFDYIAGFPVLDEEVLQPEDLDAFTIPAGEYAMITVPNLESIMQAYDAVYRWVSQSDEYDLDLSKGNFNFELYDEEFMPDEGSEKFYIYVPVREK